MYIEQAYKGLTDTWRYAVGIIFVFVCWQLVGSMPLMAALVIKADSLDFMARGDLGEMAQILGSNLFLFLMLLSFAIGLFALFVYVILVHRQTLVALTTSRKKIDWSRIFFSFGLWALVSTVFMLLDIFFAPEDYEYNFKLVPFLILSIIAITMIPIQTSMEEYFIRGYMMQGLGVIVKNRWFPLMFTTLLFGFMHILNPEVEKLGYGIMIFYLGTGLFLGIITLMDDGLELSLGFHAANNLTAALLVTADWTAFQTDSIYRDVSQPVLGWDVFIPIFIVFPLLLFFFSKKYGWSDWKERLTGKVLTRSEFLALNTTNADTSADPSQF